MTGADVLARWPTPDAFYKARDDRTTQLVPAFAKYAERPVEILVDPETAGVVAVQRVVLTACNLTARWARNVTVFVDPRVALAPGLCRDGFETLGARVLGEMQGADPFGAFRLREAVANEDSSQVLRLIIGASNSPFLEPRGDDFQICAIGWSAFGRRGVEPRSNCRSLSGMESEATAAASALAAALGVADLFKRAIGHPQANWMPTFRWDTWSSELHCGPGAWTLRDTRVVPSGIALRRLLLAGAGAIGSAYAYIADMDKLAGNLTLLDRDAVDVTNLNRSPLFAVQHVLAAERKTSAVRAYLARQSVEVTAVDGTWKDNASAISKESFDIWISLTNEDGAWAEVPFHLPPVVLQATTTSGWGFGAGRHIPRVEDCTRCRMPRPHAQFRGPCAEGEIMLGQADEPIRASLPFLSTAAAATLLALQLQLDTGNEAVLLPNDIGADLSRGLPAVLRLSRGPTKGCRGCQAAHSDLWSRHGGTGTFAYLSAQQSLLNTSPQQSRKALP